MPWTAKKSTTRRRSRRRISRNPGIDRGLGAEYSTPMFSVRYHAGFRLQAAVALLAWLVFVGLSVLDDMAVALQPSTQAVFLAQAVDPDSDKTKVFDPQNACLGGQMAVAGFPFTATRDQCVVQFSVFPGASSSLLYQRYSSYRI